MQRIVLSTLFALTLSSFITPSTKAQGDRFSQFDLVHLAKQGLFKDHNISSHQAFCSAVTSKQIRAKNLVQAGINEDRLSPEAIDDKDYLKSVENKMQRMCVRR